MQGELKILLTAPLADANVAPGSAMLRLRESPDDGCLWRLRSDNEMLLTRVRLTLLEEGYADASKFV